MVHSFTRSDALDMTYQSTLRHIQSEPDEHPGVGLARLTLLIGDDIWSLPGKHQDSSDAEKSVCIEDEVVIIGGIRLERNMRLISRQQDIGRYWKRNDGTW
jgi:hypothetical protein